VKVTRVSLPALQVGLNTSLVPPGARRDALEGKTTLRQKIPHSLFRPSGTIVRTFMHRQEKWSGYEKVSGGSQELVHVPAGAIRPVEMLENLLCDYHII
jgi:hypothetical protein